MSLTRALDFILKEETGELITDSGGLTRWGISLRNHPELTEDDIRNMTPERAGAIYAGPAYWGRVHGDDLPAWLQIPMLDSAVNQGGGTAVRILQRSLKVVVDSNVGPNTLKALHNGKSPVILANFSAERVMQYMRDMTWPEDGVGWTRRTFRAALDYWQE